MSVAKKQHHTKRKELRTTPATYLIDEELISLTYILKKNNKKTEEKGWDFSGDPVIGALCFHYRGYGFNPWSGNWDPTCFKVRPKKKKKKKKTQKKHQKRITCYKSG